jgi:hypothetical protein
MMKVNKASSLNSTACVKVCLKSSARKSRFLLQESSVTLFERKLAELYLWSHSFGPGELDTALDYSDDARYLVLDALRDVGRSLSRGKISEMQERYLRIH